MSIDVRTAKQTQQEDRLCWFCGQYKSRVVTGLSVGEMVYGSNVRVSRELANDVYAVFEEDHLAATRSSCVMCLDCLRSYSGRIGILDDEYIQGHLLNKDSQHEEVADTDTNLLPWQEKQFPFGCWLDQFPDIGVRSKFSSLSIAQLYKMGFCFAGEVWFGNWEADQLFERFPATDEHISVPEGFVDHIANTIHVEDPSFPARLARLRAVVFDVSIVLATRDYARELLNWTDDGMSA